MGHRRRSIAHWFLQGFTFCAFLVGGLFLFSGWTSAPSDVDETRPLLSVEESDLDLGTVWEQADREISIPFHNRTDRDVIVADLQPSCNCTTLAPRTFTLKPGQSQIVKATIDLLKSIPQDAGLQAPFMVTLNARIVRPREATHEFTLKGFVRRSLAVEPRQIVLIGAYELIDGTLPDTLALQVEPQIELESLAASVSQRVGSARCVGPDEDGTYRVEFTPSANLPRGPVQGVLTLQTFLPSGEKGPALDVPVSGRVGGPVEFSPNEVVVTGNRDEDRMLGPHVAALHGRDDSQWTIDGVESDSELVRFQLMEHDTRLAAFVDESSGETPEKLPREATLTVAVKSDDGRRERLLLPVQLAPYKAYSQKE